MGLGADKLGAKVWKGLSLRKLIWNLGLGWAGLVLEDLGFRDWGLGQGLRSTKGPVNRLPGVNRVISAAVLRTSTIL